MSPRALKRYLEAVLAFLGAEQLEPNHQQVADAIAAMKWLSWLPPKGAQWQRARRLSKGDAMPVCTLSSDAASTSDYAAAARRLDHLAARAMGPWFAMHPRRICGLATHRCPKTRVATTWRGAAGAGREGPTNVRL